MKSEIALNGKRIVLSSPAFELLEEEVRLIKEKGAHFKINESKLASAIIELFVLKYFNKDREKIEARFFDKKIYLKELIEKSANEEELSESLDKFLNMPKARKVRDHV